MWNLAQLIRPLPVRRRPCRKRPRLLPHYPALVEYVYNSRFATAGQIQQRLGEYLPSQRTAQYQLACLVQLGHLATAPVRSTSPNFPYVYFATGRGVRLVRDAYAALGREWHGTATESAKSCGMALESVLHEVLLTEFQLSVWRTVQSRGDLKLLLTERRYFRRERQLRFTEGGERRQVIPDAGFLLAMNEQGSKPTSRNAVAPSNRDLLMHFVELDNGTMTAKRIREKYRLYERWSQSEGGEAYLRRLYGRFGRPKRPPTFRLLVIAHDKQRAGGDDRRLAELLEQSLFMPKAMRDRLWLTMVAALSEGNHPRGTAHWIRARDIHRGLTPTEATRRADHRRARRWNHLTTRIAESPRHSLFPRTGELAPLD